MKTTITHEVRQKVLDLRRGHSLREVAELTGLALGTVKTIVSRSGSSRDNQALRNLFSLPPIQVSACTALELPSLPPQESVTGDHDLDAILWLREVIKTGQAALIEKAMLAAKRIKTPPKELETRYLDHLTARNPGNWTVAFSSFGFADLEGLAKKSISKLATQHEAVSRFDSIDNLFASTPGEKFCIDALAGLQRDRTFSFNDKQVDARFKARPDMMPNTLSDCLYELGYWRQLYLLRRAHDGGDQGPEAYAREQYVFRSLAYIRPKTKMEAIAVFHCLADSDRMGDTETEGILLNLIG